MNSCMLPSSLGIKDTGKTSPPFSLASLVSEMPVLIKDLHGQPAYTGWSNTRECGKGGVDDEQ